MHWQLLPHPAYNPNLVPSNFNLYDPLKEDLGGRGFIADNEVKLSVKQQLDEQTQTFLKGA
jgi:hypothetical protein